MKKDTKDGKEKVAKKRLILLDAHAILHRAYHALPDFASSKGEPTGALYGLSTMLIKIIADLKPDYLVACYDLPQPTYRHEVYKEYKAGRAKADPDLVSQMIRSRDIFTGFGIPIYDMPGFEADDIIGTIVERMKDNDAVDVVIASGDMDTLQLVDGKKVQVYTLKKGISDTIMYDEDAVMARFGFKPTLLPDYKGLRGDPSDNIIGIKGIGDKTGSLLIQQFGTLENMYKKLKKDKEAFSKAGCSPRIIELLVNGEEEAMFSKMLALIRRDAPINFALTDKTWKEGFDMAKLEKLFIELDFRALGSRVRQSVLGETIAKNADGAVGEGGAGSAADEGDVVKKGLVSPEEFKKVALALSVINSNLSEPTVEDILNFGRTRDWKTATEAIFAEIEKRNLKRVYTEIELALMPVVAKMEKRGVKVDVEYLRALSKEYHAKVKGLEKKIFELAGVEFNVASPKQLGEILFDKLQLKAGKKTASGARSTKESELAKLEGSHPIIPLIMEHRELSKLIGTYLDTIPDQVDEGGRLHTTYLQIGAATGRMASINPNLQNIPIKSEAGKKIRNAFVAAKGFSLVSFDYSQVELRIAAFLSGDPKLIEIFKNGRDIHTEVASQVFSVSAEKVDKEMRRRAKVINFGIIYGMGVSALKQNLSEGGTEVTRAEAQHFYNEYFKTFAGLASYLDAVKAEAARLGYTETFFGRRRYFDGIKSKVPFIRAMAERMAINAPIQGTEADIVKLASINIDKFLVDEKLDEDAHLLLSVHDELVYEIKIDKAEKLSEQIKEIMEKVIDPKDTQGVKCVAEYAIGRSWGELK